MLLTSCLLTYAHPADAFSVDYLGFTAKVDNGNRVRLEWITATEKNNKYFEIQRSVDQKSWEVIGTAPTMTNSLVVKKYVFFDEHPFNRICYYRVRQVDFDGQSTQFPVVKFDPENRLDGKVQIYPNPTSDYISIQGDVSEIESLQVFDLTGKTIDFTSGIFKVNENKIILDLRSWPPGIYIFRANSLVAKVIKT